jgi:hypothetical protein
MGAAFDCWCCVTTRSPEESTPVPGMCAECFRDVGGGAAAWEAYRLAVREGDAPATCEECGGEPCVCAELLAAHAAEVASLAECCTFCGDAPQWRIGEWTVCHRPHCARRASAGAAAVTPWWEGAEAGEAEDAEVDVCGECGAQYRIADGCAECRAAAAIEAAGDAGRA